MTEAFSVLLCEQDTSQVERLRRVLNRAGHGVRVAPDVVSAQMQARKEPPSIVAVDVMRPGGGGAALLSRLRGNVHTAHIPAVGLIDQTGENQALLDSGARECVTKPVDCEALITVVGRILDRPLIVDRAPKELIQDLRRLEVLDATNLLDLPPVIMFDRLTSLASTLLPAPTALASLVDRDRQYFKSQLSVGEPWATASETPLTQSFCQWAVASREPLIVADARWHPLLRDNRVDELGVTAYAGIRSSCATKHSARCAQSTHSQAHGVTAGSQVSKSLPRSAVPRSSTASLVTRQNEPTPFKPCPLVSPEPGSFSDRRSRPSDGTNLASSPRSSTPSMNVSNNSLLSRLSQSSPTPDLSDTRPDRRGSTRSQLVAWGRAVTSRFGALTLA